MGRISLDGTTTWRRTQVGMKTNTSDGRIALPARHLADTFVERFPDIANESKGWDWLYAGWYVEFLGVAESGYFPYAYADCEIDESNGMNQNQVEELGVRLDPPPILPLPPPGEADPILDDS